jgi:hypothetical protein
VPEVPEEGAHERVVHPLEVLVGDRFDERERALARLFE